MWFTKVNGMLRRSAAGFPHLPLSSLRKAEVCISSFVLSMLHAGQLWPRWNANNLLVKNKSLFFPHWVKTRQGKETRKCKDKIVYNYKRAFTFNLTFIIFLPDFF